MPGLPAPPFEFADSAHQIGYPLVQGDSAFPVLLPLDVVLPPAFFLALPFTLLFRYELLVLLYEQFVVCHQLHMARFKPLKSFGHTHVFSVPRAYARVSGEFRSGFRGSGYEADGVEADCVGSISFLTYFGGGAAADHGTAIALDSSGGVFFAGSTFSYNFPVVSAFQPHSGGGQDGFVAKLSASGTTIIFSTYYGGSGGTASAPEEVNAIAIGASGNAIVAGTTSSLNLPVALSPVQATFAGTNTDGFFGRISGTTGALQESRYPGGSSDDGINAVRADFFGRVYIAGYTSSWVFPTIADCLQCSSGGGMVAFVARIAWTGIVYPTYLGGPDNDSGLAMAVDSMTSITVVGQTGSPDFPVAGGLENQGAGIAGVGKGQIVRSRDVLNQNLVANRARYGRISRMSRWKTADHFAFDHWYQSLLTSSG